MNIKKVDVRVLIASKYIKKKQKKVVLKNF